MMVARRTLGPAYANLQGRKPRDLIERHSTGSDLFALPNAALVNRHEVWAERRRPTGYGALMDTTLNPKSTDPRHILVAHAYEQITRADVIE